MSKIALLFLSAIVVVGFAADLTRQPNMFGSEVVEAVVNIIRESCLFADDKRFLRRLAYVESQDGSAPSTFRQGYNGGIWQVDQLEFMATQNIQSLQPKYDIIRNVMGIDWRTVTWSDLRKPLYSGIAAALFTLVKSNSNGISWKAEEQANFWTLNFHNGSPASNFSDLAKILDLGCRPNQQVDLVFVVDTSSSLTSDDVTRALYFVSEIVDGFDIGPTTTQVGVVTYSSGARLQFYLNSHSTKGSVQTAIKAITQVPGGTATDAGMTTALNQVFNTANGARPNVVKVMVVITDGNSDDVINTQHAADNVHANAVVTFSVGVGKSIDNSELDTIATQPSCTHTFQVSSYEEIRFMKEEIQKATCIAPLIINQTYSCEISHCPPLQTASCKGGVTIETNISCGGMNVFSSVSNPYPSSAQYDILQNSLAGVSTEHYFNISDKSLFINLKDNQVVQGTNGSTNCIATVTPRCGDQTNHPITVKCFQNGLEIPCEESYFNCTETWNFPNPCTKANILAAKTDFPRFPHPYQNNKFLMCDLTGKLYVVICPPNELFISSCGQCVGANSSVSTNCDVALPTHLANPCSRESILADKLFFPYPGDVHKYIHCDAWGKPWERQCQTGMEWHQDLVTCTTSIINSPCLNHQAGQPWLYPHQCDPHRYIHCDTNHQSFVQSCQFDYVFLRASQTCVPPGSYPGTENLFNTCNGATAPVQYQTSTPSSYHTGSTAFAYVHSLTKWTAPCTHANIANNELYFPFSLSNRQYIQCDLFGNQYLRTCPNADPYYDPYSHTCVDGPIFVDGILTNPPQQSHILG